MAERRRTFCLVLNYPLFLAARHKSIVEKQSISSLIRRYLQEGLDRDGLYQKKVVLQWADEAARPDAEENIDQIMKEITGED